MSSKPFWRGSSKTRSTHGAAEPPAERRSRAGEASDRRGDRPGRGRASRAGKGPGVGAPCRARPRHHAYISKPRPADRISVWDALHHDGDKRCRAQPAPVPRGIELRPAGPGVPRRCPAAPRNATSPRTRHMPHPTATPHPRATRFPTDRRCLSLRHVDSWPDSDSQMLRSRHDWVFQSLLLFHEWDRVQVDGTFDIILG